MEIKKTKNFTELAFATTAKLAIKTEDVDFASRVGTRILEAKEFLVGMDVAESDPNVVLDCGNGKIVIETVFKKNILFGIDCAIIVDGEIIERVFTNDMKKRGTRIKLK